MSKKRNVVPLGTRHKATVRPKTATEAKHNRSREAVTRSRMTVRGRFPSVKVGRMVDWESQLERRACYLFEFSGAIQSFYEQPEPIRFWYDGKYSKYTPDFKLHLNNGDSWFVEIKPHAHLQLPEIRGRLSLASEHYNEDGFKFIVITDKELVHPARESNLTLMKYYQTHILPVSLIEQACHWLRETDQATLGEMLQYFGSKASVYALICQGYIFTNLTTYLSSNSELSLPKEDHHEALLFSYRTAPNF